jgi:predicted porin
MKKLLVVLSMALVAGITQAQTSNVTVYGVMDAGIGSISNVGPTKERVTGMQNGGLATSRLGFRGTEDLGNGLKVNFVLETEILTDNGDRQSVADSFFGRAAYVGMSSKDWGEFRLGRQNTLGYIFLARFDPMGANNFGSPFSGDFGNARVNNGVYYETPVLAGVKFSAQTGTATASTNTGATDEVIGNTAANRINGFGVNYDRGAFSTAGLYEIRHDSVGSVSTKVNHLYASYDFGRVKALAGRIAVDNQSTNFTVTQYFVGAQAKVTTNTRVNAIARQVNNQSNIAGAKPRAYTVMGIYDVSKRTALYAGVGVSDQDGATNMALVSSTKWSYTNASGSRVAGAAPAAGMNQVAYTVGIRHSF